MISKSKKICMAFLLVFMVVSSLLSNPNNIHAQNNPNTNGAQAATLRWIQDTAFDIVSLYIARSWPLNFPNSELHWREQQVTDMDGSIRSDTRQRLIRWDRRPPNDILLNGLSPHVTNENPDLNQTNLYNFVESNAPSFFVSTTKTQIKNGRKYAWTPRSANSGTIYQYEIYAPGGIDVNQSFGTNSPYPNQYEIAFPGGIRPEFIRSVRQMENGKVKRVWMNPNFRDPGELERIATQSKTPVVEWRPNHPEGNKQDPQQKTISNPDEDMYGKNGSVEEDPFIDEVGASNILPNGEYQIKSSFNNLVVDLSNNSDGANVQGYQNLIRKNQQWKFVYNENKQAYKITSSENAQLHLTWEYTKGNNATVYSGDGDEKYWKIERTTDGYYILRNYKDPTKVLDLGEDGAQNGANVQVFGQNGSKFQKWKVEL
ncbi:scabin-related ADP-ribosyltransferase, partial [Bacillus thuringiensis]|uniref:scabin-related ADP-ribosyltransferase n=1 Tax=Bacillus thuringiensis TaxID=1428 RepID=UPI0015C4F72B